MRDTFSQTLVRIRARGSARPCGVQRFVASRPCYLVDLRDEALRAAGLDPVSLFVPYANTSYNVTFEHHPFMTTPAGEHLAFAGPHIVDLTLPVGRPVANFLSGVQFHPSHQHVNPVQIQQDLPDDGSAMYMQLEAFFRRGDWHDTVFFPTTSTTEVRYQTDTFRGDVPHHCHILTHSDQGMWRNFRIAGDGPVTWDAARRVEPTCFTAADIASGHTVAPPRMGEWVEGTGSTSCGAWGAGVAAWAVVGSAIAVAYVWAVHRARIHRKAAEP